MDSWLGREHSTRRSVTALCDVRFGLLFFDFIDEMIAEFMFWKLLRTLEILLEAFDPIVHHAVRLLSRRYDLMATGYKFLEIGINVGPPSYVEITLGDHRGQKLLLSLETWKGFYEQRWNSCKVIRGDRWQDRQEWVDMWEEETFNLEELFGLRPYESGV
ncbi:hypothetical protein G5I_07442 [Acromyrmex echinatior]|uniref:Uncharacterized protein n=1 Tax=Acromyrmex echinatior TaxID=103372 RepID=F4WNT6_ACREC|nr:hypothetical protein G5I_07442 [Acromyrmex echinatior]